MSGGAWRLAAGAVLALGALAAGCGGGDDDVVVRAAPTPEERGVAPAAGGTSARDPLRDGSIPAQRLTITVRDFGAGRFAYSAPSSVKGGLVEVRLRNAGNAPHKAQLWRIKGDHTVKEALASFKMPRGRNEGLPDWLFWGGGVALTQPGATSTTLQRLVPGSYYVSGIAGRPGSVAPFEVSEPGTAATLPRAPARIEMRDFSFRVSGLRAGRNSVDVDNTGAEPHFAYFARIRGDAGLPAVRRFFGQRTSTGPLPVDPEKTRETAVLEGGERQVAQLNLPAGRYALICFVSNRSGGPRHLEFGMINEVTVR